MKHHCTLFKFTLWSLLSIWIAFGLCEFLEATELLHETPTTEGAQQDLDEEALAQLSSAIKSNVPVFDAWHFTSHPLASAYATPALSAVNLTPWTPQAGHGPPGLPLYQQISVYRI